MLYSLLALYFSNLRLLIILDCCKTKLIAVNNSAEERDHSDDNKDSKNNIDKGRAKNNIDKNRAKDCNNGSDDSSNIDNNSRDSDSCDSNSCNGNKGNKAHRYIERRKSLTFINSGLKLKHAIKYHL